MNPLNKANAQSNIFTIIKVACLFVIHSQETNAYEGAIDQRTNFCISHELFEQDKIQLSDALTGMKITAGVIDLVNTNNYYISERVLNEIGRRGGFQIEYVVTGDITENQTYTDLLFETINYNDLACDWWERRISRLRKGMIYPEGWYDAATIMIKKRDPDDNAFNFWAFSKPFSAGLWLMSLLIIIVTGIFYFLLDYFKSKAAKKEMDTTFFGSLFFSIYAFTGNCNYTAKYGSTRLLTTSMCFLYLILISAYTANLANFFILRNTAGIIINNVEDVMINKLVLCAVRGYPLTEIVLEKYPNGKIVQRDSDSDVLLAVSKGRCDVGLVSMEEWNTLKRDNTANLGCELEWIGRRVDVVQAGFALKDSKSLCSSHLENVLNLHLLQMKTDGALKVIWESFRDDSTTPSCTNTMDYEESTSHNIQLTVRAMGGAFAFHSILVVIAIFMAIYDYYRQPKDVKQSIKTDIQSSNVVKSVRNLIVADSDDYSSFSDENRATSSEDSQEENREHGNITQKFFGEVADLCLGLGSEEKQNLSQETQFVLTQKIEKITNILDKDSSQSSSLDQIESVLKQHFFNQERELAEMRDRIKLLKE